MHNQNKQNNCVW